MKKRDIMIIAAVLAVAVTGLVLVHFLTRQTGTKGYVYISVGDQLYEADPLDENKVITIDQGNGVVNHVEIKDGRVWMADSTCDNQECVKEGEMTVDNIEERPLRNYIICLPHQVTIELRLVDEE